MGWAIALDYSYLHADVQRLQYCQHRLQYLQHMDDTFVFFFPVVAFIAHHQIKSWLPLLTWKWTGLHHLICLSISSMNRTGPMSSPWHMPPIDPCFTDYRGFLSNKTGCAPPARPPRETILISIEPDLTLMELHTAKMVPLLLSLKALDGAPDSECLPLSQLLKPRLGLARGQSENLFIWNFMQHFPAG